jgi:membrane protein
MLGGSTIHDLKDMVASAGEQKSGTFARIMGVVALVLSATTAFVALQSSLNKVWRVEATPGRAVVRYLLSRLVSLGLIAAFGFLLLVSLVLETILVKTTDQMGGFLPDSTIVAVIAGFVVSFAVVTLVFASVFKFLPDVKVPWRYVWLGAMFTSVMFSLGKYLIGLYISKTGAGDAFGAGGAVIIIMLWVYYSAILLLFGAQYTQVSAEEGHARVVPTRQARAVEVIREKAAPA